MAANTTVASNATTTPMPQCYSDLYNYECANKGLLLPIINEYTWSEGTRAFLYLLGLFWSFLAVAIIADVFMCSIEMITSKTRTILIPDQNTGENREVKVKVWNDTVANLSLLALGTSAPEILLSVIEIVGNNFVAGELGPGTIVGSASFNLLFISAICIVSIPAGETRRVASFKVFCVTAFTCVFAYVWLALVLLVITPEEVHFGEAIVTLAFFPILIFVAYLADRDFCIGRKRKPTEETGDVVGIAIRQFDNANYTDEERAALEDQGGDDEAAILSLAKELGRNENISEEEAARIAAAKIEENQSHNRGWYRINASRMFAGGKRLKPAVLQEFGDLYEQIHLPDEEKSDRIVQLGKYDHSDGGKRPVVEFTAACTAVLESDKKVRIGIRRYGNCDCPCSVRVETMNGTAVAEEDYKAINTVAVFKAKEKLTQLFIEIVDDFEWEPDEFFFVKLSVVPRDPKANPETANLPQVKLGNTAICQVTIINDDEPGKLEFAKPTIIAKESLLMVKIPVQRINGADGHVSVKWRTKDLTAIHGKDYEGGEGELLFDNGETMKTIDIKLFESNKAERDESFQIDLDEECGGGATLAKISKCIVTIVNDDDYDGLVSRIVGLTKANLDFLSVSHSSWIDQFRSAMNVNGGDLETATFVDYVLHFLTFPWKVLFAFVPPASYFGGWLTFIISLAVIGFMTAIIGDLASIFGCLIGLKDAITAITLVALGTSMPDTFASKQAAIQEKNADSSVGNVNGSNSVNVFLGLGLPWVIATIYWWAKEDKPFPVPAGSLGFSVILYVCCAVTALLILVIRRYVSVFGKAELGGPVAPKYVCAAILVFLWFFYVIMSAMQAYGYIEVNI